MEIIYRLTEYEWANFSSYIQGLLKEHQPQVICDIGGGKNPLLAVDYLRKHQLECTILDISRDELDKAPTGYRKLLQNIEALEFHINSQFDFVYSRMLAEHIHNGLAFHKNVYAMLKPGGIAVHLFPTLFAMPFLINKIMPEGISSVLLDIFAPRDRNHRAKFRAYYNRCYGPIPAMIKMLESVGFEIIEYHGLIGHVYFNHVPIIREIHRIYSNFLLRHPNPYLTSFARITLRRPVFDEDVNLGS